MLLSLGALRDLRRNFPTSRIDVLARAWVGTLYEAIAEVDSIHESTSTWSDSKRLAGVYDVALLLPNSAATALPPFLARVPERWGYATQGRRALLTRSASPPAALKGRSQVYYYRAMLAGLGLTVAAHPDVSLTCPPEWQALGARLLDTCSTGEAARTTSASRWVGLNPGAYFGGAKRWPAERYAALGDALNREWGTCTVIIGGAAERLLGQAIATCMRSPSTVLCGQTDLRSLTGVMKCLSLLVTNDSGPMHLAAALGTPLVAVFGPTDWRETAPWGQAEHVVRVATSCAPCGLRECPIDHHCMTRVSVDMVVDRAREALSRAS